MDIQFSKFYHNTKHDLAGYAEYFDEQFLSLVKESMDQGLGRPGYRDGVLLVPIYGFYSDIRSRVVKVDETTQFVTMCKSRVPGEKPRIKTVAVVDQLPFAKYLFAVLYRADVLAEDDDRSTDAEWEIVTVLAQTEEEEPMHYATLMANHFKADGGTDTQMNPEQFEAALRKSYDYWKTRSLGITTEEWERSK